MEREIDGHLPFIDTDIYRRPNGSMGHKVYHHLTHPNLYLKTIALITTHPTRMPFFLYWYTGLQHSVIKIAIIQS
jgi:hypothetical protein